MLKGHDIISVVSFSFLFCLRLHASQLETYNYDIDNKNKLNIFKIAQKIEEVKQKFQKENGANFFAKRLIELGSVRDEVYINGYMTIGNCKLKVASKNYYLQQDKTEYFETSVDLSDVKEIGRIGNEDKKNKALVVELILQTNPRNLTIFLKNDRAIELLEKITVLCHKNKFLMQEKLKYKDTYEISRQLNTNITDSLFEDVSLGINQKRQHMSKSALLSSLLTSGHKSLEARLYSLAQANKHGDSIKIQSLIYLADEVGVFLANKLIEKAQKGVKIEVYIDALASAMQFNDAKIQRNTFRMYHNLMAAGIPVYGYECKKNKHLLEEMNLSLKYRKPIFNQRFHEKIWIVNNYYAIVGGRNIANNYFTLNSSNSQNWRDQDILLVGEASAEDLGRVFDSNTSTYIKNYNDPKNSQCFNKFDPLFQTNDYYDFYLRNKKEYKLNEKDKELIKLDLPNHIEKTLWKIEKNFSKQIAKDKFYMSLFPLNTARIVHSRPKIKERFIEKAYLELIKSAQKELIISNAYFIPSEELVKSLKDAAKRGVAISILTNSLASTDIPPAAALSREIFLDLVSDKSGNSFSNDLLSNISIYEWTGIDSESQIKNYGMNHAKFIIVDQTYAFVGSFNLDQRSRDLNSEVGVLLKEQAGTNFLNRLTSKFYKKDLKHARKLSFYEIALYGRPLSIAKLFDLKQKGLLSKRDFEQFIKYCFYLKIAKLNKKMW